jgi:hypothetical protein
MTLLFSLLEAQFAIDVALVLLFRDNVQHHLQGGRTGPGYALIHALGDAVIASEAVRLPSRSLWVESELALQQIKSIELGELAVSLRTRALLTGKRTLPSVRGTVLYRHAGWTAPPIVKGARSLGELFGELREGLHQLTEAGTRSGLILVRPSEWAPGAVLNP